MDRRTFNTTLALAAATAIGPALGAQPADGSAAATPAPAAPFRIGMLIYDDMTLLDFAGPADAFGRVRAAKVHVLAKSQGPVSTDTGGRVLPDMALRDAPELDLLFIGGGHGATALMEDAEVLEFLSSRAPRARYVTAVCTGSLVLGAAGLLRGYNATTHWTAMDVLPLLGARVVRERVVIDRNRITGAGVTAGIDFGLTVISEIWGKDLAQLIQLGSEYDPKPPFDAGSPLTAPPAIVERYRGMMANTTKARADAARRVAGRFR